MKVERRLDAAPPEAILRLILPILGSGDLRASELGGSRDSRRAAVHLDGRGVILRRSWNRPGRLAGASRSP